MYENKIMILSNQPQVAAKLCSHSQYTSKVAKLVAQYLVMAGNTGVVNDWRCEEGMESLCNTDRLCGYGSVFVVKHIVKTYYSCVLVLCRYMLDLNVYIITNWCRPYT